jgi:hypothetical protein
VARRPPVLARAIAPAVGRASTCVGRDGQPYGASAEERTRRRRAKKIASWVPSGTKAVFLILSPSLVSALHPRNVEEESGSSRYAEMILLDSPGQRRHRVEGDLPVAIGIEGLWPQGFGVVALVVRGQHSRGLAGLVGQSAVAQAAADQRQLVDCHGEGMLARMRGAGSLCCCHAGILPSNRVKDRGRVVRPSTARPSTGSADVRTCRSSKRQESPRGGKPRIDGAHL